MTVKHTHCDWCERPYEQTETGPRIITIQLTTSAGPNRLTWKPYRVCSLTCYQEYVGNLFATNPEWHRPLVAS